MGNIEYNSIEDLVFSRSFRNWVLTGDSSEAGFWEDWIARNQDRLEIVNHAKAIIYALQINRRELSEDDIEHEITRILQRSQNSSFPMPDRFPAPAAGQPAEERDAPVLPGRRKTPSRRPRPLIRARRLAGIAAAILLVFLTGSLLRYYTHSRHKDGYEFFLADNQYAVIKQQTADAGDTARVIDLPDGSRVRLAGKSKLYYAADLSGGRNRREVYLTGEAFFEIRKNAALPFYVLTNSLITKVLGTSFRVQAYPADPIVRVTVRTGKISVYRKNDLNGLPAGGNEPGGIVVTPNQVIIYDRQNNELNKILTEQPEQLAEGKPRSFVFDATPVSRVFKILQETYGIPIVYDEELLSSCSLSATMGNESFYEKLNIICKAINASYEVIDGNIVITAAGCK